MAEILELRARDRVKSAVNQTAYYLKKGQYGEVRKLLNVALIHLAAAENHQKEEKQ